MVDHCAEQYSLKGIKIHKIVKTRRTNNNLK